MRRRVEKWRHVCVMGHIVICGTNGRGMMLLDLYRPFLVSLLPFLFCLSPHTTNSAVVLVILWGFLAGKGGDEGKEVLGIGRKITTLLIFSPHIGGMSSILYATEVYTKLIWLDFAMFSVFCKHGG